MVTNLKSLAPVLGEEASINAYSMSSLDTGNACEPTRNNGFEIDPITTTPIAVGANTMNKENDISKRIEFEVRDGPRGPSVGKQMGYHWVFKNIFQTAWYRFCAAIESADWTKPQTAKSLFDDPNWVNMGFGFRIALGRCLRYFVNHAMLPLRVLNPDSSGTKKYAHV